MMYKAAKNEPKILNGISQEARPKQWSEVPR